MRDADSDAPERHADPLSPLVSRPLNPPVDYAGVYPFRMGTDSPVEEFVSFMQASRG